MSSIDPSLPRLTPASLPISRTSEEPRSTASLIQALKLQKHIEGGYFCEIDRDPRIIPNPFLSAAPPAISERELQPGQTALVPRDGDDRTRNASTSIFYLLSKGRPVGCFHRNKGRTVHTVIKGRGRYVVIHADEDEDGIGDEGVKGKKRVETFVVGKRVEEGERMVWVVEGGKYKASFLLQGDEEGEGEGLLISETVVPGFEYVDHDFLMMERFRELVTAGQAEELEWLVRRGGAPEEKDLL